jgi:hypothetical protein
MEKKTGLPERGTKPRLAGLKAFKKLSGNDSDAFSQGDFEHGDANPVLGGGREDFNVLAQAAEAAEPGEGPPHDPAFGAHRKAIGDLFGSGELDSIGFSFAGQLLKPP